MIEVVDSQIRVSVKSVMDELIAGVLSGLLPRSIFAMRSHRILVSMRNKFRLMRWMVSAM